MNSSRNFLVVHEFDLGERPEPLHKAGVVQVRHDERNGGVTAQIVVRITTITVNIQIAKDTGAVEAFLPAGAVRIWVRSELSLDYAPKFEAIKHFFMTKEVMVQMVYRASH